MGLSAEDAAKRVDESGNKIDSSVDNTGGHIKNLHQNFTQVNASAGKFSNIIRLVALGVTALSGPMLGILALGPLGIFAGLFAGAEMFRSKLQQTQQQLAAQHKQMSATQQLEVSLVNQLIAAYSSLKPYIQQSLGIALQTFQQLLPIIRQAAQALGPMLIPIVSGLSTGLQGLLGGAATAMQHLMPIAQALGRGLGLLLTDLGTAF